MLVIAERTAAELGADETDGYRVVINIQLNQEHATYHPQIHVMAGRKFEWPPGWFVLHDMNSAIPRICLLAISDRTYAVLKLTRGWVLDRVHNLCLQFDHLFVLCNLVHFWPFDLIIIDGENSWWTGEGTSSLTKPHSPRCLRHLASPERKSWIRQWPDDSRQIDSVCISCETIV